MMRAIVVGLGVQGYKRRRVAGADFVADVDPVNQEARYRSVADVPLADYDAALVCVPDEAKLELLTYLLGNGKHVLVAHFVRMRELIASRELGRLYRCRMFYGNGTARLVRDSAWRDQGAGVLPDLGSHLLDTARFWFGKLAEDFAIVSSDHFENRAPDHVVFGSHQSEPRLELEMTLLSWRNHFTCDLFAERGSAHISSLCKWGPSTFTRRTRVLPSGRPTEDAVTLVMDDPTWAAEYAHFRLLCGGGGVTDLSSDLWLNRTLRRLGRDALAEIAR